MLRPVPYITFKNKLPANLHLHDNPRAPWNLKIPAVENSKVIFIFDYVRSEDIFAKELLSRKHLSFQVVQSLIHSLIPRAEAYGFNIPDLTHWSAISFHMFKTFDLDRSEQERVHTLMLDRLLSFISSYAAKGCLIVSFSDDITKLLDPKYKTYMLGHPRKLGKYRLLPTVDLFRGLESYRTNVDSDSEDFESMDDDKRINAANFVVGQTFRHLLNGFAGRDLHDLSDIKPDPIFIETLDSLDSVLSALSQKPELGYDLETDSLSRVENPIFTLQLSASERKSVIIPLAHPASPLALTSKTLQAANERVRNFLLNYRGQLLGHNIQFDLAVAKSYFKIPWVDCSVWDTMLAEMALDENIITAKSFLGYSALSLDYLAAGYHNYHYFEKKGFSKGDRHNIRAVDIRQDDFLEYAAMDTQILMGIKREQIERSKYVPCIYKGKMVHYSKVFSNYVGKQISNNVQVIAQMEHNGHKMDISYLKMLRGPTSPLIKLRADLSKQFQNFDSAKKANTILLKEAGHPTNTLFGKVPWILSLTKPRHKQVLFFDILGLDPVHEGKSGDPSVDKDFQKQNKEIPEVALFTQISKLNKLISSYVVQFLTKLEDSPIKDARLRAKYLLLTVTGRSMSRDPSFQQLPHRTEEAKIMLRSFIPREGALFIEPDFSTHEVRVWCYQSVDEALADLFTRGRLLRKKWRETEDPAIKEKLIYEGDPHRINAQMFLGAKTPEEIAASRDATKGISFGLLYGMSLGSLARNIKKTSKFTSKLVDKFFNQFKKGARWLKNVGKEGERTGGVMSILGRRRNLPSYLVNHPRLQGDLERRAKNSPIQGSAADIGHTAAWLFLLEMRKYFLHWKIIEADEELPASVLMMVHDSTRIESDFKHVLACLQIYQWVAMEGTRRYYQKEFNVDFPTQLEVEFKIGAHGSAMKTWDWSETHLKELLQLAVTNIIQVYPYLDEAQVKKEVFHGRRDKELRDWLNRYYPFFPERGEGGFDYEHG